MRKLEKILYSMSMILVIGKLKIPVWWGEELQSKMGVK